MMGFFFRLNSGQKPVSVFINVFHGIVFVGKVECTVGEGTNTSAPGTEGIDKSRVGELSANEIRNNVRLIPYDYFCFFLIQNPFLAFGDSLIRTVGFKFFLNLPFGLWTF